MAYDFDGTDDYIEALSAPATAAPLTMACWFNVDNVTANHVLMSLTDGTDDNRFFLAANGAVAGDPVRASTAGGGTTTQANSATGFTANTWHHAVGRYNSATNRRAYIDGVGGTTATTNVTPTGIDEMMLGATWAGGVRAAFTNGRIAEVAIWNVGLNDDEIASLADGFRPSLIRPSSLVFYAPLVREIADYRGGISLTVSGALVAAHTRRIA